MRAAFADLHYDIHHAIADGDLVAVNSTMNGRHVAPWAVYTEDGAVDTVFPPTSKTFAMTQSHWFRIEDGRIIEHWANRDDLGMARSSAGPAHPGLPVQDGPSQAPRPQGSGVSQSTPSGGTVIVAEAGRPCQGSGTASTPPRFRRRCRRRAPRRC